MPTRGYPPKPPPPAPELPPRFAGMTVCTKCEHVVSSVTGYPLPLPPEGWLCGANSEPSGRDPVTGIYSYQRPRCAEKNTGSCPDFQRRVPGVTTKDIARIAVRERRGLVRRLLDRLWGVR